MSHTQSTIIESEEDEQVEQECLQEIEPYGNEFNPSTATHFLSNSLKSKFDLFCPTWRHATSGMRDLWFSEFKKYCRWDSKYDARIRQIFYIKGEERQNYAKKSRIQAKIHSYTNMEQLIHHWASDKKFKNLTVTNIANHNSNKGSSIHTGGSISME